ncbi:MAG: FAD-binding oxidoreductase [bacterium]|nr:FAD-binding oxidoreductase [bacterium]
MVKIVHQLLSGWGRVNPRDSRVCYPTTPFEIEKVLGGTNEPIIARGLGRSYGDAAVSDAITVNLSTFNFFQSWNPQHGIIRVSAGTSLKQILDFVVPQGWFLPVTPGTQYCTVGGCVAADVHGKNHHIQGSFSKFVHSFDLMCSGGSLLTCNLQTNSDLFFATLGGMGLTGVIVWVELQLTPVQTIYITERKRRIQSWEECIEAFQEDNPNEPYAVAWVDATTSIGKGELWYGRHTNEDELPKLVKPYPKKKSKEPWTVPNLFQNSLVNRRTITLFNRLKYLNSPKRSQTTVVPYWEFFYPLDRLLEWNRLYGKSGFIQYQYVVPFETNPTFHRQIVELCLQNGQIPSLAVFKRMGKGIQEELPTYDHSLKYLPTLSFPKQGWTLALDFPMTNGLLPLLSRLDQMVIEAGGRVYLAKDVRLSPETFRKMYPELSIWKNVCRKYNDEIRFQSSLSKRLQIC